MQNQEKVDATKQVEFFPKGAIVFFGVMLIGFGLIWLGLYALMVQRQGLL